MVTLWVLCLQLMTFKSLLQEILMINTDAKFRLFLVQLRNVLK